MTRITYTTLLILFATLAFTTAAMAQGTASGPSTVHVADNSGVAYAGGPLDLVNGPAPYPIDLNASGPPWRKAIKRALSGTRSRRSRSTARRSPLTKPSSAMTSPSTGSRSPSSPATSS